MPQTWNGVKYCRRAIITGAAKILLSLWTCLLYQQLACWGRLPWYNSFYLQHYSNQVHWRDSLRHLNESSFHFCATCPELVEKRFSLGFVQLVLLHSTHTHTHCIDSQYCERCKNSLEWRNCKLEKAHCIWKAQKGQAKFQTLQDLQRSEWPLSQRFTTRSASVRKINAKSPKQISIIRFKAFLPKMWP